MKTNERDLSMHDLADLTGRHVDTLRRLAKRGKLPGAYRIGRKWLIAREVIERMRQAQS